MSSTDWLQWLRLHQKHGCFDGSVCTYGPEVDFGLRSSYAETSEQLISHTHMQSALLIFNALTSPMASLLDAMYCRKVPFN